MSHIDGIKHELLGYLNGLPIYHPLESMCGNAWGDYDFNCTPENLVLGGGSGEHPALVLHDLGGLAAFHLWDGIKQVKAENPEYHALPSQSTQNRLRDMVYRTDKHLEFCDWSMQQIHAFVKHAKSPLNRTPFKPKQMMVEDWIRHSIGEFILYSLPELNPDYNEIIHLDGISDWMAYPYFCNVLCPPPNYAPSKKQTLHELLPERGFFRWDYVYPPKSE